MKKLVCTLAAAVLPVFTTAFAFDYNTSVDEIAADPLTAYQTVYLGMPRADFDGNFSILPDWKFHGSESSYQEWAERKTTSDGVTVIEGIEIFSASPSPVGKVIAFDSYFKTADKNTAKGIYTRLVATVYANMENFPESQQGNTVIWVQNDVTIVVSYDGKKDADGMYIVRIHRYNNHVLHG